MKTDIEELYNAHFTFFHGKSTHFAMYFIQNNTKLTPLQTLGAIFRARIGYKKLIRSKNVYCTAPQTLFFYQLTQQKEPFLEPGSVIETKFGQKMYIVRHCKHFLSTYSA